MGREVRRVPLDFDWPVNKVWQGYLLPERLRGRRCPACESGQTHFGWWLQQYAHQIAMLANDVHDRRHGRPIHPWLAEFSQAHSHLEVYRNGEWQNADDVPNEERANGGLKQFPYRSVIDRPSDDALQFFHGLLAADYAIRRARTDGDYDYEKLYAEDTLPPVEAVGSSIGHCSSGTGSGNIQSAILNVLSKAAGVDTTCSRCRGEGVLEEFVGQSQERDAWEPTDPPDGEGWQYWETVTEGSPISPVFATAEELSHWLQTDYHWGASGPLTKEQADSMVQTGWAPSLIVDSTGVHYGDEVVASA